MNKENFKNLLYPTIILLLICLFSSLFLALTNKVSSPLIEKIKLENENKAKLSVVPEADKFSEAKNIEYQSNVYKYYEAYDNNKNLIAYVFTTVGKGYGGDVVVMTGVDKEGKIKGINLLQLSETAGLGMKATNPNFLNQFVGLNALNGFTLVKNTPKEDEVQALTGATITSNAITEACNIAFDLFKNLRGVSNNG